MKNNKRFVSLLAGIMAAVLILSLLAGIIPAVSAASSAELQQELSDLKAQRKQTQEEISKLSGQIDENMTEIEKIVAEKNAIDREITLLYQQIENINRQIQLYGQLIADKQDELDQAKARYDELSAKNKDRIRAMEENGKLSYWSVLFEANSFSDLLDRLQMIEEIAKADQRRLQELREAAQAVEAAQEALNAEKTELEATRAQLDQTQKDLEKKRQEADAFLAELAARDDILNELLALEHEADEDLQAQIAKTEKEYNEQKRKEEQAQQQQQQKPSTKPNSTVTDGIKWTMPCSYVRLSSPYGYRTHPIDGQWKFHSGVDLAGPEGTPIVATRDGTVTAAAYSSGNGNYVTINHGDGFSSSYLHMTHDVVSVGQKVKAGQIIGYMGNTGYSKGSHLHFTIYYNGNTVNPADYLDF